MPPEEDEGCTTNRGATEVKPPSQAMTHSPQFHRVGDLRQKGTVNKSNTFLIFNYNYCNKADAST